MKLNKFCIKNIINQSFSLIEITVVIFIFLLIITVFFSRFLEFSADYANVSKDVISIKKTLELAREKSLIKEEYTSWGVYFENSSSAYYLFAGPSFASSVKVFVNYLSENNKFLNPPPNSHLEIIFMPSTGYATNATITISSLNEKIKGDIIINSVGTINTNIYK